MGAFRKLRHANSVPGRFLFDDGVLLIPLAALIALSPRLLRGVSCGHDFDFHLVSWLETHQSWSQGVVYPHWAQTPNWGAGEPRFIFYPPLTWMLGALLGYVLPWTCVAATLVFLFLTAMGLSTRAFTRLLLPGPAATLAGILATATPYALFTIYERSAFGELAASAAIPLLLLFAWRQQKPRVAESNPLVSALDGSVAPLALVLAAIWLTNAPAGVMAGYLLAFAALASALLHRQWWLVLRAAIAAPIGIGLAAFFLVPAIREQRWVDIRQAISVGMQISDSWLYGHHRSLDLLLHDQVLHLVSNIVVITVVLSSAGFLGARLRGKLPQASRAIWIPLALLIPIFFFLQFQASASIWRVLPELQFLQFPWRWLSVLDLVLVIFLAAATSLESRRSRVWSAVLWTAIVLISVCAADKVFFQPCDDEDAVSGQLSAFQAGTGVEGTDEYAAVGSDNSLVASGLPDGCLVSDPKQELGEGEPDATPVWYSEQGSCDDTYAAQVWRDEHKVLRIDSDHDGFVILHLRRYPAWEITVNGKEVSADTGREDGLIVAPVKAGPSLIEVRWKTTPDVLWGRVISLASLIALAAIWMIERRWRMVHLS